MLPQQWIATGVISSMLLLVGFSRARNRQQMYETLGLAACMAALCIAAGTGVIDMAIDYFK